MVWSRSLRCCSSAEAFLGFDLLHGRLTGALVVGQSLVAGALIDLIDGGVHLAELFLREDSRINGTGHAGVFEAAAGGGEIVGRDR